MKQQDFTEESTVEVVEPDYIAEGRACWRAILRNLGDREFHPKAERLIASAISDAVANALLDVDT